MAVDLANDIPIGSVVEFRHYRNRGDWKIGILTAYEAAPGWEANWQIEYPVFKNARDKKAQIADHWMKTPWMKRDLIRKIDWVKVQ